MSIVLKNIHKWFQNQLIVHNISMEVKDEEFFVLLGGSGSGKSTLLRIIAGLLRPTTGSILMNSRDVTDLRPQERNIGFVFQNYSVFRDMTVSENVEFGLKIRDVPKNQRRKRSAELLDLVGLSGLGNRYADQLSGGQLQRVALARALAYEPAILLLDEPFGALDVKIRSQLRRSLREVHEKFRVTTVLVTHDQEEAFELADRVGVMEHGQLVETGIPKDLYHFPKTEFTARFIGGGNVLVGTKEGDHVRLGTALLPFLQGSPSHDEHAPVCVLFRPESIVLQTKPFAPEQGVYVLGRGFVKEIIFTGLLQRVLLEIGECQGAWPLVPRLRFGQKCANVEAAHPSAGGNAGSFSPGQDLWIGLKSYHILAASGLKVLVYIDESTAGEAAADLGLLLAGASGGEVRLLAAVDKPHLLGDAHERLEEMRHALRPRLARLTVNVRQGDAIEEIVREAFEGHYELVVLCRRKEMHGVYAEAWKPLLRSGLPVVVVQDNRKAISRVLICTEGGEPGKGDVLFGARVIGYGGAHATLLHIVPRLATPFEKEMAGHHLLLGKASLDALGISSDIKLKAHDSPVEGILQEMEEGDYDLAIVGGPSPRFHQRLVSPDLTTQILHRTSRPVLVVPMMEE